MLNKPAGSAFTMLQGHCAGVYIYAILHIIACFIYVELVVEEVEFYGKCPLFRHISPASYAEDIEL